MQHPRTHWRRLLILLAVCAATCFLNLGRAPVTLMEARNFVAAREMTAGGSWLIPTMNGALRLAKPPLPTWAVTTVQRLTGPTENLALLRLPAALMTALLVFFFWGLVHELTRQQPGETEAPGRTAWLAALMLASSLLLITVGREGQWDIFANSFMVGALWALLRAWQRPRGALRWFVLGGVLLGGSFLSKGPVVLYAMLVPFAVAFFSPLYPHRGLVRPRLPGLLLAVGVGLAIGLAWPAYLALQHEVGPAALAVARTEVGAWAERHAQPFWYYWNFPVFVGVWAPVAWAALAVPYARPRAGRYVPYLLGLGWLLLALVLISAVPEKKERYMLPLLPPLVLVAAGLLRHWVTELRQAAPARLALGLMRGWAGLLALVCVALPVVLVLSKTVGVSLSIWTFGLAAAGGLLAAACLVGLAIRQRRGAALVGGAVAAMVLVVLVLPAYFDWKAARSEPGLRTAADLRLNATLAQLPWYTLEAPNMVHVWEAGRAIPAWPRDADSLLVRPTMPVAVVTGQDVAAALPAAWRAQAQLQVVDSFNLGTKRKDGYWRVTVVRVLP
ncbi:MAG TPA: glycosyltransferase family 39 protein [Hymenobacter sp.]|uniref:ArnT family glycosyltransferase n=1 Tax=Hymenobacter sp. TaxID=1898978 RepID=UPI002ED81A22